jgi:hypothetical protein
MGKRVFFCAAGSTREFARKRSSTATAADRRWGGEGPKPDSSAGQRDVPRNVEQARPRRRRVDGDSEVAWKRLEAKIGIVTGTPFKEERPGQKGQCTSFFRTALLFLSRASA